MKYLKSRVLAVTITLPSIALADESVDAISTAPERQEQYRLEPALSFVGSVLHQGIDRYR